MSSDEWHPLSVRRGGRDPSPLHEGVPPHLVAPLRYWLQGQFGYRVSGGMRNDLMFHVVAAVEVRTPGAIDGTQMQDAILAACSQNDDAFLDVIDATLRFSQFADPNGLRGVLGAGRSAWTVDGEGKGLIRRVDPTASAALDRASKPNDAASIELREAWTSAYGRDSNPSDTWDHAIKAVEAVLIPIVCPNQAKPTLGHVLGGLRSRSDGWRLVLPGPSGAFGVEPLISMLDLIWPNPDRHGSPGGARVPAEEEAWAVLHLAIAVVQWARDGSVLRR